MEYPQDKRPLMLPDDVEEQRENDQSHSRTRAKALSKIKNFPWCLVLLAFYSVVTTTLLVTNHASPKLPYSIAKDVTQYEIQDVDANPHTIYNGEPSEEYDNAWSDLLMPMHLNVSYEEMKLNADNPQDRLELYEGGFFGALGVYHQLHCLRRIAWNIDEQRYYANATTEERDEERHHLRHCLEIIRRDLMCHADTSLMTFKWRDAEHKPAMMSTSQRKCVAWEPLHAWALQRAVSLTVKLKNPDLHRQDQEMLSEGDLDW